MKVIFCPAKTSSLVKICKIRMANLSVLCLDCHDALGCSRSDVRRLLFAGLPHPADTLGAMRSVAPEIPPQPGCSKTRVP